MPHILRKTVFKFEELSDEAKEKAREWYRDSGYPYDDWWDAIYDDAERVGEILGIEFEHKRGSTPSIWFTGFYHQGQGSAFDGTYRYAKGCVEAIKKYAPLEKDLHQIAKDLVAAQKFYFYRLRANIKSNRDNWINVEVYDDEHPYQTLQPQVDDLLTQPLRDFNSWIFRSLEKEYEYLMSDECVDENIQANDYDFDEDGSRA